MGKPKLSPPIVHAMNDLSPLGLSHVERPLSPLEKVIWRLSDAAPLNFTVITRVRGSLAEATLRNAIAAVSTRHPYLRVRIERTKAGPVYRTSKVPTPALRVVAAADDQWATIVEDEINCPIPWDTGPLVRCVLVRHSDELCHLLLTVHHVIGDGMAGAFLARELLSTAGEHPDDSLTKFEALNDTTPMDLRLPESARGLRGAWRQSRFALRSLWDDLRMGRPAMLRPDCEAPPNERQTRVVMREFDEEFTRDLAARARREGTTVHCALSAAVCLEMAQDIGGGRPVSVKHRSPVDMRRFLEPRVGKAVGMFASVLFFRGHVSGGDDFWELARSIYVQFMAGLMHRTPMYTAGMLPRLYSLIGGDRLSLPELAARWRRYTRTTTGLTSVLSVDLPARYGALKVESLQFAVSPSAIGDFTCNVSKFGGRLFWNFMLPEPILGSLRRDQLVEAVIARTKAAVAS